MDAIKSGRREPNEKRKRGRPGRYTQALCARICERLADGESLNSICKDEGMPHERTVRSWALDPVHPFSPNYARAREAGFHRLADELLDISDDGRNDWIERENRSGETYIALNEEAVARSRMRLDTRKWLLSKCLPKTFGDKVQHTGEGGDGPVKLTVEWLAPSA